MAVVQPTTRPPPDTWTAAIHRSENDQEPLGAGVVIDEDRVLTSAHVLYREGQLRDELWVAFPRAGQPSFVRRRAEPVPLGSGRGVDLALLRLTSPAPPQVAPARLRCVEAAALVGTGWWAFGFPRGDHLGDEARGTVSQALAYEHIQLSATAPYRVETGFSGAGVWCPEYAAVVGLLVMAKQAGEQRGDGRALTLYQANVDYPELKLLVAAEWSTEAAGDEALAAWGWMLRTDPEEGRHWSPRARGVSVDIDRGYRFRGRTAALTEIVRWLDRPCADSRILVVTGSPGVGKSAVLGRVVTTADEKIREALPPDDDGVRATIRSVACAVHVKGKTALDVAQEIARAASVALPSQPEDLVPALQQRLSERAARFNLVVDALDEAASSAQSRLLLRAVLLPLALSCAGLGFQAVVATRRADSEGDLLSAFGHDAVVIDLDDPKYFAESDLVAYAMATLQLVGAERVDNPYTDPAVAMPVAQRIATLAQRNFLVAGLVARAHGLHDVEPVPLENLSFTPTVDAAVDAYLVRLFHAGQTPARMALTVLAFAEAPGLPLPLWRAGIIALGCNVTEEQLARFARSSAGNFLVETGTDPARRAYRLFHQALNDALLRGRSAVATQAVDERRLVEAWLHHGKVTGWAGADYLLRWLPAHAQRAGAVDDLLAEDEYLLHADLRQLVPVADEATSVTGRARARLLQRSPLAVNADPPQRAAMFSVAETLGHLDSRFTALAGAPYRGLWARTPRGLERTILEGHADAVLGVCPVPVGEQSLLASAGADGTVRLWDPATGQTEHVFVGHAGSVRSVCAVPVGNDALVASAGEDGTIRLWDPGSDGVTLILNKHTDWVRAVCAVPVDGQHLVASGSDDRTVRLWDPVTGQLVRVLVGHAGWVTALCPVPLQPGGALLASAGYDGTIRIWDPATGHLVRTLYGHAGWVTALCAVPSRPDGGALLASAGYDGTVRIWDVTTGQPQRVLAEHTRPVHGVTAVLTGGRGLLASAGEDGDVRVWDPVTGCVERVLSGHTGWVYGICTVPASGRHLLASASDDGTVRLWNPATGKPKGVIDGGRIGRVTGLCTMASAGGNLLVSTSEDGSVRLWDPTSGAAKQALTGHGCPVSAVCAVTVEGRRLLASASEDRTVRLWNVDTGQTERVFEDHEAAVTAVVLLHVEGRRLLASGDDDRTVRLWDPTNGRVEWVRPHYDWVTALCAVPVDGGHRLAVATINGIVQLLEPASGQVVWDLQGHPEAVTAVCAVAVDGRHLIASASDDHTIRLWDPDHGAPVSALFGHTASVTGLCVIPRDGRELLASTSTDRTVRLWDPGTGVVVQVISVHHRALACWYEQGMLVLGLDTGILAIQLR